MNSRFPFLVAFAWPTVIATAQSSTPVRSLPRGAEQICQTDLVALDPSDRAIDSLHPKYFVEVSEISTRGTRRLIHTSVPSSVGPQRVVCQRVNSPVDLDSKIVVRVNQSFLQQNRFDGKFSITARVEGLSGGRAVEVPGYSVIGKSSETVPVSVADVSGLGAAMREIRRENELVRVGLAAARSIANRATNEAREKTLTDANQVVRLRTTLRVDSVALRRNGLALMAARQVGDTSRAAIDSVARLVTTVDASRGLLSVHEDSLREADATLRIDSLALRRSTARPFLAEAKVVLGERRHALTAIGLVAAPDNLQLVRAYARVQRRLPQLVVRLARSIDSLWTGVLSEDFGATPDSALGTWEIKVRNLAAALGDLAESDRADKEDELLSALVIDAMKDAEITIRQTGAQVGDILVLSVTDTVGDPGTHRELQIRLPIREFGFVRRVSDAVMLMNVPGLAEASDIAAAQARADASGQGSSLVFPLNLRGAPSAGITLSWTYLPRLDDDYAFVWYGLRSVFNWLRPGLGLNASVISVAHKAITITPKAAASESAKDPEVGYTFGVVSSAFEGAVQLSLGRPLTGDRARTYSAMGISFLAATDKAKDLFKALVK